MSHLVALRVSVSPRPPDVAAESLHSCIPETHLYSKIQIIVLSKGLHKMMTLDTCEYFTLLHRIMSFYSGITGTLLLWVSSGGVFTCL